MSLKNALFPLMLAFFASACEEPADPMSEPDAAMPEEPDGGGCGTDEDAMPPPPEETWAEEVLAGYEDAARAFERDNGLPAGWADWMIERKDRFAGAYVRARTARFVRVSVRYDRTIAYDPPWADETEHYEALERLAELAYNGWDFEFVPYGEPAEFHAVLGHSGPFSYAGGDTVHLVWEAIFNHEIGHLLGIGHHYCDCCGADRCADRFPPGEEKCIMTRTAATWGPAEQFILLLGNQRHEDEAMETVKNINDRYPPGWP